MGTDLGFVGSAANPYPGDMWVRLGIAARAAKIDAIDGPFPNFKDVEGYRRNAIEALALGFASKWAIHPAGSNLPSKYSRRVAQTRKLRDVFLEAEAKGLAAAQIDGQMVDIVSLRILKNTLDRPNCFPLSRPCARSSSKSTRSTRVTHRIKASTRSM